MATSTEIGEWGERFACRRLQEMGFSIRRRNYRYANSQIDIIAQKDEALAFVEVKLRGGTMFSPPEEAVRSAQRRRIIRGALAYIYQEDLWHLQPQFDVLAITVKNIGGRKTVHWEYFPGAFDASDMGL